MLSFRFSLLLTFVFGMATSGASEPLVLLTGGTGYIGSHVAIVLMQNGYDVVLADNLSNSEAAVVEKIERVGGKKVIAFYNKDLAEIGEAQSIFVAHKIDAVIHLAGFKAVKESIDEPIYYYQNNLISSLYLLDAMKNSGCPKLVFSSSATVYGSPLYTPIDEQHRTSPTNPYGQTKLMIEQIMKDAAVAMKGSQFIALRYFNPVGAHESGLLGERPKGVPNNLVPYMLDVVTKKQPFLRVFGTDYNTHDGSAVRDYIHVMDLAEGHLKALNFLFSDKGQGFSIYNLGTGKGYSVLDMVKALSKAWGQEVPYQIAARREGDVGAVYADPSKARNDFGFVAGRSLELMMADSLRWALGNSSHFCGDFGAMLEFQHGEQTPR